LKTGVTLPVRTETVFKLQIENNNLIQPRNPPPKNNQSPHANHRVQYNKVFEMVKHLEKPLFVIIRYNKSDECEAESDISLYECGVKLEKTKVCESVQNAGKWAD
jgi:hypothetical protein